MIVVTTLLTACVSSQPEPVVTEPAEPELPAINIEMVRALTQLNDLKEELKLLRNTVEELQFQQKNANRRQQDLFQDIDGRLLTLEKTEQQRQAAAAIPAPPLTPSEQVLAQGQTDFVSDGNAPGAVADVATIGQDSEEQSGRLANTATVANSTTSRSIPPATTVGSGSTSVSLNEQDAYDNAFELLKQSKYQDAINQFQSLVNTWPNSQLADDAMYWMSEANYVNREFEVALNGFRTLVQNYPDSSRVPEAMLKVGYIQYDIGAYDQAAETFQDILTRFPGHQVTVSAETRLRRIQQTIQ